MQLRPVTSDTVIDGQRVRSPLAQLSMVEKTKKEGVLRIRVLNRSDQWVALPYFFYYGADRIGVGSRPVKSYRHRAQAAAEARKTLLRLRAQNRGHTYDIDE